ncbi:MAG: hypothetical protein GOMPHAMPRED_007790 [Gomphillus americanus]|uniref:Uncharacterized protein n=1 Tax=Gomphillus americanus TaxID=1940652 RepID=A0A8H3EWC1_9LECA|nr:MAG: hypothetical protein GOMPHAMPRED_007790 [Gomphillus americanus]
MKLNILTHLFLLSFSFFTSFAWTHAHEDVAELFRRQYFDELIERDLESDIKLLRRAFGASIDGHQHPKLPALRAHEELSPLAFDPRMYKTTKALTPGAPDHPAERLVEKQAEKPATPPVLPEIQLLPPMSLPVPESEDHYASDRSSGSAGSTGKIVDRRKKPARGGRSHAYPHGKRGEIDLAAPLFLGANLRERHIELEDFFDYF